MSAREIRIGPTWETCEECGGANDGYSDVVHFAGCSKAPKGKAAKAHPTLVHPAELPSEITDPPAGRMSAERISYAAVLRRQAAQVDNVADQYALVMDGGEHDTSEVQPARTDAAALRELARRLAQLTSSVPPGVAFTEAGAREFIDPEAAMQFAAFCAAGFKRPFTTEENKG